MDFSRKSKLTNWFIIGTFTLLYLFVSIISMIHTVEFFQLSNPYEILAISLAVAFELGAAASLATVVTQDAMNKFIVWSLFIILTLFQMMGNTYYAYHNLAEYSDWSELFAINDLSIIEQKRYLAILSGAILPVVALGYIKCLVDYLKSKQKNNLGYETEYPNYATEDKKYGNSGETDELCTDPYSKSEEKEEFQDEYLEENLSQDELYPLSQDNPMLKQVDDLDRKLFNDIFNDSKEENYEINKKDELNDTVTSNDEENDEYLNNDNGNFLEENKENEQEDNFVQDEQKVERKKEKKKPQGYDISRKTFI